MQDEIWKRYMSKIRSIKFEESRKAKTALFGHTDAASEENRMALIAVCLWSGTCANAEFYNLFQSMVMNCGRGSEIGIARFDDLSVKEIK